MRADVATHARDGHLQAFLCCLWVLMLLGALGGELRLVLHHGGFIFASFLVATFYLACFLTRAWLIDQAVFNPNVVRGGRKIRVELTPALAPIRSHVQQRARELKIPGTVHVLSIPGTWHSVDAYVFGTDGNQFVVLSRGLMALYRPEKPEWMERFRFVVDHELGHVAGRDTELLYLARATIMVGLSLLLVKATLIFVLGADQVLRAYADMFPRKAISLMHQGSVQFTRAPDDMVVVVFFVVFSLCCVLGSTYFYMVITRRREELADRFAVAHSADRTRASEAMEHLLHGMPLTESPPHAFLGARRWHPSATDRLASVRAEIVEATPHHVRLILVVFTFLSIRFMLGAFTSPREYERDVSGFVVASAAYALIVALLIHLVLRDGIARTPSDALLHSARQIGVLTFWTAVVSGGLVIAVDVIGDLKGSSHASLNGAEFLADIESTERRLLVLSAPIIVAVFGIAHLLLEPWRRKATGFASMAMCNCASSTVALLLLAVLATLAARPVSEYRASRFTEYWNERMAAIETGQSKRQRDLAKLRDGILDEKMREALTQPSPFMPRQDIREELRHFPMEVQLFASRLASHFVPPLSFVFLWHAPLRSAHQ